LVAFAIFLIFASTIFQENFVRYQLVLNEDLTCRYRGSDQVKDVHYFIILVGATVAFGGMTQLDVVFAGMILKGDDFDDFVVISVFGKTLIYASGGIVLVMFPSIAKGVERLGVLFGALFMVVMGSAVALLLLKLFGIHVLNLLYGARFEHLSDLLDFSVYVYAPLTLIYVLDQFLLAVRNLGFMIMFLVLMPMEYVVIANFADDLRSFLYFQGAFSVCILVVCLIFIARVLKQHGLHN